MRRQRSANRRWADNDAAAAVYSSFEGTECGAAAPAEQRADSGFGVEF